MLPPMLNIAIRAARAAGDFIIRKMDRIEEITVTIKNSNDFVTDVDKKAEDTIIRIINNAYPSHAFLAEESGKTGNSDFLWIIDPLDGTTNFLHGFPHFAVSIALEHKGIIDQAVIYDPLKQELFTASKGGGAQLNNRKIRVNPKKSLEGALLGTGFPFRKDVSAAKFINRFKLQHPNIAGIRCAGAASLDLAYVACGRLDGFWKFGLKPWDIAAGAFLIREAGGICCDINGEAEFLNSGSIVSANPTLLKQIIKIIKTS